MRNEVSIMRVNQLCKMIGLSRSTIYEKMRKDSRRFDAMFPLPIKLSTSAIGWRRSEVEDWLASLGSKE